MERGGVEATTTLLRGSGTVIATVVILAVTIAVAVAIVSYTSGVFSSTASEKPMIVIMPDSYVKAVDVDNYRRRNPAIHLHIVNRGSDAEVAKIVVSGLGVEVTRFYLVEEDMSVAEAYLTTRGVVSTVIPGGSDVWVIAMLYGAERPSPGTMLTIDIYTKDGSVFTAMVKVKK